MRVFLERVNSDYLFEVENKNGQKVLLDNSSKTSGKVEGISPMESVSYTHLTLPTKA